MHVRIRGAVQGVGFRYQARSRAHSLDLDGFVRNLADGSVEAAFEGEERSVGSMLDWCRRGPAGARVEDVDIAWEEPTGERGFAVR